MRLSELINAVISISEKYEEYSKKETSSLCYEVLHISLSAIIEDFSAEQIKKIPLPYRSTMKRLEKNIFAKTSEEYQEEFKQHKAEQKEDSKEYKSRITTRVKSQIGFRIEEEGLSN